MLAPNVLMLDSGCLWGGPLTAVRLPDRRVYQVPSRAAGAAKAVRIDVLGRARELAAMRAARAGNAGGAMQLDDERALAAHAPERRHEDSFADVRRRDRVLAVGRRGSGSRPAARGPRASTIGCSSELVERQQLGAVGRRAFGEDGDDVAARQRVGRVAR